MITNLQYKSLLIAILALLAIFSNILSKNFLEKEYKLTSIQFKSKDTFTKNVTRQSFHWKEVSMKTNSSSCLQLDKSLPLLLAELKTRNFQILRQNSTSLSYLSPIIIPRANDTNNHENFLFNGLTSQFLSKVFRGKKVAFIGDSTVRTIYVALKELLELQNITDLTFDNNFTKMVKRKHAVAKVKKRNFFLMKKMERNWNSSALCTLMRAVKSKN